MLRVCNLIAVIGEEGSDIIPSKYTIITYYIGGNCFLLLKSMNRINYYEIKQLNNLYNRKLVWNN